MFLEIRSGNMCDSKHARAQGQSCFSSCHSIEIKTAGCSATGCHSALAPAAHHFHPPTHTPPLAYSPHTHTLSQRRSKRRKKKKTRIFYASHFQKSAFVKRTSQQSVPFLLLHYGLIIIRFIRNMKLSEFIYKYYNLYVTSYLII